MEDSHNISDDFEIRQDLTMDCGVSCPCAFEKTPIDYNGENLVSTLEPLFFILARN